MKTVVHLIELGRDVLSVVSFHFTSFKSRGLEWNEVVKVEDICERRKPSGMYTDAPSQTKSYITVLLSIW